MLSLGGGPGGWSTLGLDPGVHVDPEVDPGGRMLEEGAEPEFSVRPDTRQLGGSSAQSLPCWELTELAGCLSLSVWALTATLSGPSPPGWRVVTVSTSTLVSTTLSNDD